MMRRCRRPSRARFGQCSEEIWCFTLLRCLGVHIGCSEGCAKGSSALNITWKGSLVRTSWPALHCRFTTFALVCWCTTFNFAKYHSCHSSVLVASIRNIRDPISQAEPQVIILSSTLIQQRHASTSYRTRADGFSRTYTEYSR